MNRLEDERRHYLVMLKQKKADLEQKRLGRPTCCLRNDLLFDSNNVLMSIASEFG